MKRIVLIGAVCLGVGVSAPVRADYVPDPVNAETQQRRRRLERTAPAARARASGCRHVDGT